MSLPGNDRADEFLNNSSRSREVERRDLSDVNAASAAADDDSSAIESRICDLQKSLDYLISRDERSSESDKKSSAANNNQDEAANAIPNLVNNILKEHYGTEKESSSSTTSNEDETSVSYVDQKVLMTQLLIAVIIEFTEPHFVKSFQWNKVHAQRPPKKPKTDPSDVKCKNNDSDDEIKFSKRAVEWATSCISRLLQTTTSADDPTHIPELDALLGATGENDGLKLEEMIQSSLLCGLMGARDRTI